MTRARQIVRGGVVRIAAAAALLALAATTQAAAPVPPLTGPVVDAAGLLDAGSRRRLEELSRAARAAEGGQGVQLQYLIVPSLEGEPIEDYSIRVAEAWKIGTKGKDNGVLVTVAPNDRQVRIEVGGGLEGGLTDAQSSRIIRYTLVPAFRQGHYGEGLYDAGVQILSALGSLPADVRPRARPRGVTGIPFGFGTLIAIFVVLWVVGSIFRGFGPRRRRTMWWGGGGPGPWWSGGGFGGGGGSGWGGGGGGGWSGGGGGFSGGGASGRW